MAPKKSKKLLKNSQNPSLSAGLCEIKPAVVKKKIDMKDVSEKIFNEVNRKELEKSLDKWLKTIIRKML